MNSFTIKHTPQNRRPIVQIANQLGCRVKHGKEDMKEDGKLVIINQGTSEQQMFIIIKPSLPYEEQILAIAHELAHLLLGHLLPFYNGSGEQAEFEAEALGYMLYSFLYNPFYREAQPQNGGSSS